MIFLYNLFFFSFLSLTSRSCIYVDIPRVSMCCVLCTYSVHSLDNDVDKNKNNHLIRHFKTKKKKTLQYGALVTRDE